MLNHHRTLRDLSRALARAAALLVLASIAPDLVQAGCDPLVPGRGAAPVATVPGDVGDDACAEGCVPDCYGCSTTLAAAARVGLHAPFDTAAFRAVEIAGRSGGSLRLPDPVPRPTA